MLPGWRLRTDAPHRRSARDGYCRCRCHHPPSNGRSARPAGAKHAHQHIYSACKRRMSSGESCAANTCFAQPAPSSRRLTMPSNRPHDASRTLKTRVCERAAAGTERALPTFAIPCCCTSLTGSRGAATCTVGWDRALASMRAEHWSHPLAGAADGGCREAPGCLQIRRTASSPHKPRCT